MARPVHFEIHSSDPERTRRFYSDALGWTFERWGDQDYWLITTGREGDPGINGGMVPRHGPPPAADAPVTAFVCTVAVSDLDAVLGRVESGGAQVALPRQAIPGVGWLAYIRDPDGNLLGLMQPDEATA